MLGLQVQKCLAPYIWGGDIDKGKKRAVKII